MRFVVVGPGAIGGAIGGRLAQHGHEVALVARGAHLQAIRSRGLRVESPEGTVTVDAPVFADPVDAGLGPGDVVVLAVKSQDTASALDSVVAAAPSVPVVCAQNGVDNERSALRLLPDVYGMCVMCPATHVEPGVVLAHAAPVTGILDVGRYPAGVDETAVAVAEALRTSGFESEARRDIMRWKYAKLLRNLGNAVEAVCGPQARGGEASKRARREGEECLEAAGIDVASAEEDDARRGDLVRMRPIAGKRWGGGSSWQSLVRGAGSIEADYLNGEVVLLGRLHGVPTPVNAALQRHAVRLARQRAAPGAVSEAELLGETG